MCIRDSYMYMRSKITFCQYKCFTNHQKDFLCVEYSSYLHECKSLLFCYYYDPIILEYIANQYHFPRGVFHNYPIPISHAIWILFTTFNNSPDSPTSQLFLSYTLNLKYMISPSWTIYSLPSTLYLSLIHIWRCRRRG